MRKILGCVLLGGLAIASQIAPAAAVPFGAATVYKVTDSYTNITSVYISGTANSRVSVDMGSSPRTSARIAGSCGEVRVSPSTNGGFAGLKIDGVAVDATTLSTMTLPSCANGTFAEPRTSNFKTASGQVVIVGKTPGAAVSVALNGGEIRNVSINACGFGTLKPRTGESLPTSFIIGSTTHTLANVPDAGKPPLCRTANGLSSAYIPSTWP